MPELDELLQTHGVLTRDAEALDARIQELRNEVGLRRYLPESLGGVSPGEKLAAAEARREEIRLEVEAIESRVRAMETEQLASAEARREEIRLEVEAIESRVRAMETEQLASVEARYDEISREMETVEDRIRAMEIEQLASAEARREEIRHEMETVEDRIRAMETEQLASVTARREEIGSEVETVESEIRVVEEELECIEKRRAGEECVSLLGKLSAMGGEGYARVRDLIGKAGGVVTTIVKLTIVVIVKNVLLPMAFLMIAVKYALPVARYWARLTSDFRGDVKELRNTLLPDAGSPLLKEKPEDA